VALGEIALQKSRRMNTIESTFRFRSDETPDSGGRGTAPPPLAYLCAGVAFCYLTQLGRYARITHRSLDSYAVSQRATFREEGSSEDDSLGTSASPLRYPGLSRRRPDQGRGPRPGAHG